MENVLLIGVTRQMTLRREMSIIANNLANVNTAGFKAESPMFEEFEMRLAREESPDKTLSFVQDYGLNRNFAPGKLMTTGAPLDVAISGEGFFKIQTPDGTRYTRDGHFQLDAQGRLVTQDGQPVLNDAGGQFTFAPEDGDISIASDGTVSTTAGQVGKLGIVDFAEHSQMKKVGSNLYETEQVELPAADFKIAQGMIELSNVQAIVEMTNMIEVLRSYTSASKLVDDVSELQRRAVSQLGRLN